MMDMEAEKPQLNSLAERVKWARKQLGITQGRLARKVFCTQSLVTNVERGLTKKPRNIKKLAEVLGFSVSWLMTGKEELVVEEKQRPRPRNLNFISM